MERPRLRDLGISPGILPAGPLNAITDVRGVLVGHRTIVMGNSVRTGVTAILPHTGNLFQSKTPAAVYVGNGFGKAAGFLQVRELGTIETPIVLTSTLSVGTAVDAVIAWTLEQPGNETVRSVNALVGETNDGYLNDIRSRPVTAADVRAAIAAAEGGSVPEGSVGAGTGTRALGWKGGIGTASRRLPDALGGHTVGALVQTNFGGILTIDGRKVGEILGRHAYRDETAPPAKTPAATDPAAVGSNDVSPTLAHARNEDAGSCMIVLATDAPLDARNLERLAARAVMGLARTGSFMDNGSGDFVIAFSTANLEPHDPKERVRTIRILNNDAVSPLFLAAVESVEEAIINSLLRATAVTGHEGHSVDAIPIDRLRGILSGE